MLDDHGVITFENGRFTNELREVIMELLSMNVSMYKVNAVIKTVLKKLAGIYVHHLPSAGSQSRFLEEALILAKMQVVGEMNACMVMVPLNIIVTTKISSPLPKYHRHYQNIIVTTKISSSLPKYHRHYQNIIVATKISSSLPKYHRHYQNIIVTTKIPR